MYYVQMVLKAIPPRKRLGAPVSFRIDREASIRLRTLSELLGGSQAKVIAALIEQEYEAQLKTNPKGVASARKTVEASD